MAQIPGVPDISPVEISPRVAGRGGQTIAGMGEDIAGMGFEGIALESHIIQAQKSVDQLASHNQLNAEMTKYHDALAKTTNSRDVQEVSRQYQDQINGIAAAWNKSPAASEIQMAADSLRPQIEHFGTVRQVDLMGKEWAAQSTIQIQTLLPQMVAAHRGGRTDEENAIKQHINNIYDDAISKGLITKSDKDMDMNKVESGFRKDLNEAAITSPDQKERTAAINQLKKGGSGPLELTNLTAADTNALLIKAEEDDKRINSLTEAHNLNGALNTIAEQFQAPEFKNNYEARLNALQDGEWLKKNGIVAEDGSPDRVMAEKLIAETTRQRSEAEKVQQDRDEKFVAQYSPQIEENRMTRSQIDSLPDEAHGGVSNKARAMLTRQWVENNRINRQLQVQARSEEREARAETRFEEQEKKQKLQESSEEKATEISMDIAMGKVYEPIDIYTMDGLTHKDKMSLIQENEKGGNLHNPYVKTAADRMRELPLNPSSQNELFRVFLNQVKSGDLRGSQITQTADELIDRAKKKDAAEWIDQTFSHLSSPGQITARESSILRRGNPGAPPAGFDVKVQDKNTKKWYWANSTTHAIGSEVE